MTFFCWLFGHKLYNGRGPMCTRCRRAKTRNIQTGAITWEKSKF